MEQSSNFTMASLPGFVSAGSHQVALAAANAAAEASAKAEKALKRSTTSLLNKRPTDQKSILGFMRTGGGSNTNTTSSAQQRRIQTQSTTGLPSPTTVQPGKPVVKKSANTMIYGPYGAQRVSTTATTNGYHHQPKPAAAVIEPELAGHKLGGGKLMTRPVVQPVVVKEEMMTTKQKHYTFFSSSPTKPPPAAVEEDSKFGKANEDKDENENEAPVEPTRSAACLHTTTCNLPQGLGGGFRRPAGLSREGIAPMEKLRKPFKPLTISRS
jgi:DNA helicase-2/ATP-dependent DNA helicase PcrA